MLRRVVLVVAFVVTATLLPHPQPALGDDPFVATGSDPTQGKRVPGSVLTADLGHWNYPPDPDSYTFQWLRDGTAISGATERDYLVQPSDVGHQIAPYVTARRGSETAYFTGGTKTIRQIRSHLRLDVRRVHVRPDQGRLVWMAIAFMETERPWPTDGGSVAAYRKRKGKDWKQLGTADLSRSAAFVRLPWRQAPYRPTRVKVCYPGSEAVAVSCSPYVVVRRPR